MNKTLINFILVTVIITSLMATISGYPLAFIGAVLSGVFLLGMNGKRKNRKPGGRKSRNLEGADYNYLSDLDII